MKARATSSTFGDFRCAHCHALVSNAHVISGVNHRNHCPYCLWSCHLDLYAAGDRLSACKALMRPVGLTLKQGRKKYLCESRGELMVVHQCTDCETLSINRIAADDDSETVMAAFQESLVLGYQIHSICQKNGIMVLKEDDVEIVYTQLYGHTLEFRRISFS